MPKHKRRQAATRSKTLQGFRLTDFEEEESTGGLFATMIPDVVPRSPIKMMIGDVNGNTAKHFYEHMGWARMYSTSKPAPYPGEPWGFDNGAWSAGHNDRSFPELRFLKRLRKAYIVGKKVNPPWLAVVPDIVMGGPKSLDFSLEWMPRLESLGYRGWPWYLAVQHGMDYQTVEEVLPNFDGLFLGGSWELRFAARRWQAVARRAGVPFHYGGCGTRAKLAHAFELGGVNSLDSAGPLLSKKGLREFMTYYEILCSTVYPEMQDAV